MTGVRFPYGVLMHIVSIVGERDDLSSGVFKFEYAEDKVYITVMGESATNGYTAIRMKIPLNDFKRKVHQLNLAFNHVIEEAQREGR